jgi:hypothetical protein
LATATRFAAVSPGTPVSDLAVDSTSDGVAEGGIFDQRATDTAEASGLCDGTGAVLLATVAEGRADTESTPCTDFAINGAALGGTVSVVEKRGASHAPVGRGNHD